MQRDYKEGKRCAMDLISRQAALDIIDLELNGWLTDDERLHLERVEDRIASLPTIAPVKHREWMAIGDTGLAACECGYITDRHSIYRYCPKCGSKMEVSDATN